MLHFKAIKKASLIRHLQTFTTGLGSLRKFTNPVTLRAEPVFVFVLIEEVKIRWMNMKLINNLVFLDFFWNEFLVFLS